MSGLGLMIAFVIAIIVMIVAISKYKIHPFLSIMTVSLVLGLVAGIPLVDTKVDGKRFRALPLLSAPVSPAHLPVSVSLLF